MHLNAQWCCVLKIITQYTAKWIGWKGTMSFQTRPNKLQAYAESEEFMKVNKERELIVKEKSRLHFEASADNYEESFDGKYVMPMYEGILKRLKEKTSGKILDIGCGTGNVLVQLANGKRELYGIDLSEKMAETATKRLGEKAVVTVADAQFIPYPERTFDILICNASFHHYPHPGEVLREMHRVLKPGGMLLLGEGYALQPFRMLLNFYFRFSKSGDFHSYGIHELKNMLSRNNFQIHFTKQKDMRLIIEATAL